MATESKQQKTLFIAGLAALALGAGAWAYTARSKPPAPVALAAAEDPGKLFEKMREARERKDLSEEERHKIFDQGRRAMENMMDQRVNAWYTAATLDAKKAMLDRDIDEMQKRMKEFESRRDAASQPSSRPNRGNWMGGTPQERKSRSESRSPDKMARQMAYFTAMQQRAKERGIQTGGGPGGGPRGGGGGRRG